MEAMSRQLEEERLKNQREIQQLKDGLSSQVADEWESASLHCFPPFFLSFFLFFFSSRKLRCGNLSGIYTFARKLALWPVLGHRSTRLQIKSDNSGRGTTKVYFCSNRSPFSGEEDCWSEWSFTKLVMKPIPFFVVEPESEFSKCSQPVVFTLAWPMYSLVPPWNWFSDVTGCTWITCTSDIREPIPLHQAVPQAQVYLRTAVSFTFLRIFKFVSLHPPDHSQNNERRYTYIFLFVSGCLTKDYALSTKPMQV